MSKITKKELEMLSAYMDGELSEDEIIQIEKRIKESAEYEKEYQELKKIKALTSASFSALPETQFFETRLNQKINSSNSLFIKLKKWSPAIGFSVLAVLLMLILKFNPTLFDQLVEKPKATIAGFYKQNLQPLLYAADLSNEDIFNFAFYKQLPLDKSKNQYILLDTDSSGREYFEITNLTKVSSENNLNKFVTALNLTEEQKVRIDSIIGSYAEELQSQILINDDNTVAVNRNLWNYNKALAADLVAFASANNSREVIKIIPANLKIDTHSINLAVNQIKSTNNDDYIFMTPDTIFSEKFQFDKEKFKKEMEVMKKGLEKMKTELKKEKYFFKFNSDSIFTKFNKDSVWEKNFKVTFDTSMLRVRIPHIVIPHISINTDSILKNIQLDKITKNLKDFNIEMPKGFPFNGGDLKIKYTEGDSIHNYKYNLDVVNVDSIIRSSLKILDSLNIKLPNNFNFNFDSLQLDERHKLKYLGSDKINKMNKKELEKQILKQQEEIRKMMDELKREKEQIKQNSKNIIDTVKT